MVSVQARRVKLRRCIIPRSADLGSWGAESARFVCEMFVSFFLEIMFFSVIVVSFSLWIAPTYLVRKSVTNLMVDCGFSSMIQCPELGTMPPVTLVAVNCI